MILTRNLFTKFHDHPRTAVGLPLDCRRTVAGPLFVCRASPDPPSARLTVVKLETLKV